MSHTRLPPCLTHFLPHHLSFVLCFPALNTPFFPSSVSCLTASSPAFLSSTLQSWSSRVSPCFPSSSLLFLPLCSLLPTFLLYSQYLLPAFLPHILTLPPYLLPFLPASSPHHLIIYSSFFLSSVPQALLSSSLLLLFIYSLLIHLPLLCTPCLPLSFLPSFGATCSCSCDAKTKHSTNQSFLPCGVSISMLHTLPISFAFFHLFSALWLGLPHTVPFLLRPSSPNILVPFMPSLNSSCLLIASIHYSFRSSRLPTSYLPSCLPYTVPALSLHPSFLRPSTPNLLPPFLPPACELYLTSLIILSIIFFFFFWSVP